jgi:hypothetical protein
MAVEMGRREKQGDCKNAFVHSYLPKDETIICRPPKGCPLSKPGDLWLLRKTLYGLRRSPYHWYQNIKKILLGMGLETSDHDHCVFTGKLAPHLPPIYLGLYVDDFKYFSSSNETKRLFEKLLGAKCKVDFMGEVSWFLGCKYEWEHLPDGRLTVSITQTAKSEDLIETHGMIDCNPVASPYRSEYTIDKIADDGLPVEKKTQLVTKYQSLVGGLLWLQRQSRPDISAVTHLLAQPKEPQPLCRPLRSCQTHVGLLTRNPRSRNPIHPRRVSSVRQCLIPYPGWDLHGRQLGTPGRKPPQRWRDDPHRRRPIPIRSRRYEDGRPNLLGLYAGDDDHESQLLRI